jgi:hypothetical protein
MRSFSSLCAALALLFLAGCAGLRDLTPGETRAEDIRRRLGTPAMTWQDPDGRQQWAYPTGPRGFATWMVHLDPAGRLERLENVLDMRHFARIQPGMSQAEVLRILGPSVPAWTVYYEARDELVWEWRYCDEWAEPARFDVYFDGTRKTVRTASGMPESLSLTFVQYREYCGH